MIVLHGHPGIGPVVSGTVLVANDGFSARYDLDRKTGLFSRPSHTLAGQSYVGVVLALNTAKGGVATAWMLRGMMERGIVPRALLFNRVNPIMAQGAAFAGLALIDRFDCDITQALRSGDTVRVDPGAGEVTVLSRAQE